MTWPPPAATSCSPSPPPSSTTPPTSRTTSSDLIDDGTHSTLIEAAETCAALGGVFLRVVWDTDIQDRPWIDLVPPDAAVPEFKYGRLVAVTFWT